MSRSPRSGVRVVKSFGREDYAYDRFDEQLTNLYDTQVGRVSVSAKFWTLLEVIPNLHADHRARLRRLRRRPRLRHDGHAGRVHHDDAVAGVAHRVAGLPAVDDARSRSPPPTGSPRSSTRHARSPTGRRAQAPARRAAGTRRRRLPLPDAAATTGRCGTSNATVEPGRRWRWSVSTGSGKSVLAALLSRLYDVTEGEIRIDGQDIRELTLPALRQAVATAFEDPTLFSMSVAENLRLGPAVGRDEQQLARGPSRWPPREFVYDLPFGLDTRIGEQGTSLSGGQRQRLSLARAILAAPRILVLDDTLSALDVHTEAVVERGAGPGAAPGHGHRGRAPGVDRAARRQGRAARGRHHHALSAPTPSCWPACREYRYLLAADDELDDRRRARCAGRTTRTASGWSMARGAGAADHARAERLASEADAR